MKRDMILKLKFRNFCPECYTVFKHVPLSSDGKATECPECEAPWIHCLKKNVLVDVDGEPIEAKVGGGTVTFSVV